jgi:tRNA A-37 threonylcarbamoyl transferase component Bud32/tetratricopeptide (TPR) repeat protein
MAADSIRPEEAVRRVLPLPVERRGPALRSMLKGRPDALMRALDLLPTEASTIGSVLLARPVSPAAPRIGPYELRSVLGEGGFGVVWLATQLEPVRRSVALKILRPDRLDPASRSRFDQERRLLALLNHPALVKVFEAGETPEGRPWFTMELAEGAPITEAADAARLPLRDRVRLLGEVARAVHHAHEHGLVHRDLKPSNILLAFQADRAVVKVIDFGVAHAIFEPADSDQHAGALVGTPDYLPPELLRLHTVPPAAVSDVFALGILLRRLLAGSDLGDRRIGLTSALEVLSPDMRETVARERGETLHGLRRGLRGDLDAIVSRCLADDPRHRYATALELAQDLDRHLAGEAVLARGDSLVYRGAISARRNAAFLAAAALVSVTAIAGFLWASHERRMAMQARDEAQIQARQVEQAHAFIVDLLNEIVASPGVGPRTAADILAEASHLAGLRLASQPGQEADVRTALGRLWLRAARPDEARREFDRVRQLTAHDASAMERIELLMAQAQTQRLAGHVPSALDSAQAALAEAQTLAPEDPDEVARALMELASTEIMRGDLAAARAAHDRAARLLQAASSASDPVRSELEQAREALERRMATKPVP